MNNGYTSDKEAYKLMECNNNMWDQESHYNKNEGTFEEIVEEIILMGDADDDQNGFPDEEEMPPSVMNAKLLVGATEKEELGEMGARSGPAAAREETTEEMVARIGGMVRAALDAVRAAAGLFPGLWKAIARKLEKLRACLLNPSCYPCHLEKYDTALSREVLQSVADMLAAATDIAERCRAPLTAGKLQLRSSIDAVTVKLDVSLRDCELLLKIGELYDDSSSPPPLDDITACTSVRELQRLLALLQMSHTAAKKLALDGLLEALHKDEKSVIFMLHAANVSTMVQLLTASWPMVVREKAATVVCHMAGSSSFKDLLVSEGALVPLIRLAESGGLVGRQKAMVALHHLSSKWYSTARAIVSHGGVRLFLEMCRQTSVDSVSQSAAAGTLKNITVAPDFRQALADHGTVRVMVDLLRRGDAAPESKEHAVQFLQNLTARYNDDGLRRSVLSEGGLLALLLYLRDNDEAVAVNAIRNLVDVISTTSGSADDDTTTMKRVAGEQGCVPLLVRMIQEDGNSDSAREVAAQALASLATYPPNVRAMTKDDKCVAGLVQLLDQSPDDNTAKEYAIQCLLSLASTKRCRKLMISHGANVHLRKLSDTDVEGATELLQRLERGILRSLFSGSKQ
ncbi:hypothetical protein QOZ80_9BG0714520 [Eleusine coracana subsp. coracana]|nr:hypothetical protein QOZ80_9BG0714520 [Eleusine coracana subsp. coracana]